MSDRFNEIFERLTQDANDEMTIRLTSAEWGAVATLLALAIDAGCPAKSARTALEKVKATQLEAIATNWPNEIM